MSARIKARHDSSVMTGWYAACLAAQKRLKPFGEYFLPTKSQAERREEGTSKVRMLVERMLARKRGKAAEDRKSRG